MMSLAPPGLDNNDTIVHEAGTSVSARFLTTNSEFKSRLATSVLLTERPERERQLVQF